MAQSTALCADCFEPVTPANVESHMAFHGYLSPDEWKLAAWPDGEQVLIDYSFLRNLTDP